MIGLFGASRCLSELYDQPARRLGAERRPRLHQLAPFLEQVAAPISSLDLAVDRVASAISTTSLGKLDRSAAQSRNAERKPCVVTSTLSRRNVMSNAITESGCPVSAPAKTKSLVLTSLMSARIDDTLDVIDRILEEVPSHNVARRYRAASLAHLGRLEEACREAVRLGSSDPMVQALPLGISFRDRAMASLYIGGLEKAGLVDRTTAGDHHQRQSPSQG